MYRPESQEPEEMTIQVEAGDFDLRGFEITRTEFFGGIYLSNRDISRS